MSVCQFCGKAFVPARLARFCSVQCYQKDWYSRKVADVRKVCPICGAEFHPSIHSRAYCSIECMKKGKRLLRRGYKKLAYNQTGYLVPELVERVCAFCGKEFMPTQQSQRYCCRKCQKTADNKLRSARRAAARVVLTKTCAWCGQTFQTTRKDRLTCSKACSYERSKHQCSREELAKRREAKRDAAIARAAEKAMKVRVNGLTAAQMQAVVDAQDGDPALLWKLSQNWTPAQRKYAKARYESMHGLWTQTFYG